MDLSPQTQGIHWASIFGPIRNNRNTQGILTVIFLSNEYGCLYYIMSMEFLSTLLFSLPNDDDNNNNNSRSKNILILPSFPYPYPCNNISRQEIEYFVSDAYTELPTTTPGLKGDPGPIQQGENALCEVFH
ncbi:hypothetical protein CEXT_677731 [Caerostris extrusa]|uniref:Uncharacterized protein n=1 Tax=Caerostris extrusa TaxID=172846 RepID=A0AAV4N5I1_CAEEX|nr:hypothetical protein CEXT_677731 [Caerostris extrusa]